MDQIETMRAHRRFTLVGGGSLRGDPEGMWTTYRHLEEKVAAERSRIRRELEEWFAAYDGYYDEDDKRHMMVVPEDDFRAALDRICPEEK